MEFWINAPVFGLGIDSTLLCDIAEAADELGFDALVVADHVLMPKDADPELIGTVSESIVTLSYMASRTKRIRLGTSVLVAPIRNAVILAKQVATLDVLTGGRAFIGLAAGWSEFEFNSIGAEFHTRGAYTDETIRLMRHLFSGSTEPFEGRFHQLADYRFAPLPPQGASLPILVGGLSPAAYRRAALLGDMWQSSTLDYETFRSHAEAVKALAGERQVSVGTEVRYGPEWGAEGDGTMGDKFRAEVASWEAVGCERISIGFRPVSDFVSRMELFAREVLPAYR
jgi:probable F420-dependent oxidoreductase